MPDCNAMRQRRAVGILKSSGLFYDSTNHYAPPHTQSQGCQANRNHIHNQCAIGRWLLCFPPYIAIQPAVALLQKIPNTQESHQHHRAWSYPSTWYILLQAMQQTLMVSGNTSFMRDRRLMSVFAILLIEQLPPGAEPICAGWQQICQGSAIVSRSITVTVPGIMHTDHNSTYSLDF